MWILRVIAATLFVGSSPVLADDILVITDERNVKHEINKSVWPVAFRCYHYDGPKHRQFWFSLRSSTEYADSKNGWMIFDDHTGYKGDYYRDGLDWRFDWTSGITNYNYSFSIKSGSGFYWDWRLADENGEMTSKKSAECR